MARRCGEASEAVSDLGDRLDVLLARLDALARHADLGADLPLGATFVPAMRAAYTKTKIALQDAATDYVNETVSK
jgi:hypothetical protein